MDEQNPPNDSVSKPQSLRLWRHPRLGLVTRELYRILLREERRP